MEGSAPLFHLSVNCIAAPAPSALGRHIQRSSGTRRSSGSHPDGRPALPADPGGIRTGSDVFKALALGADAVLIARPFVTAVYGAGADGVAAYTAQLGNELADTMRLCGAPTLDAITRDMVRVIK